MEYGGKCPRDYECDCIEIVQSDNKETFVCIGYHLGEVQDDDIFRHCFKSETTDTMNNYSTYDILSVQHVFSKALLIDKLLDK